MARGSRGQLSTAVKHGTFRLKCSLDDTWGPKQFSFVFLTFLFEIDRLEADLTRVKLRLNGSEENVDQSKKSELIR